MTQKLFVITRPREEGRVFADELESLGFSTLLAPMLAIEPAEFQAPDLQAYQALIFTSANGVRHFCARVSGRGLPVYVVGQNTRDEAAKAGFTDIHNADGDAVALTALIQSSIIDTAKPLLHVRGVHAARELDQDLAPSGLQVDVLTVYEAQPVAQFPGAFVEAATQHNIDSVLFFSSRTAENFAALIRKEGLEESLEHIKALCISTSVLECVQDLPWKHTAIALRPNRAAMLDLLKGTEHIQ